MLSTERGGWDVTEGELFKVLPAANRKPAANGKLKQSETPKNSQSEAGSAVEIAMFRMRVEALDVEIAGLKQLLAQVWERLRDREGWRHHSGS